MRNSYDAALTVTDFGDFAAEARMQDNSMRITRSEAANIRVTVEEKLWDGGQRHIPVSVEIPPAMVMCGVVVSIGHEPVPEDHRQTIKLSVSEGHVIVMAVTGLHPKGIVIDKWELPFPSGKATA
jgi:hypothetical protein